MAIDELTDPDYDEVASIACARYRGRSFETDIRPLLERLHDKLAGDVKDGQLVFAGYSPAEDTFVVAFDLWLAPRNAGDDAQMAQETFEARLVAGAWLGERVKVVRSARTTADGFYGEVQRQYESRYPDLVELVLD